MANDPKLERVLARFEPGRREAVRKVLIGAAVYTAPVVASFSMDSLAAVPKAKATNMTSGVALEVPATSPWSLAGIAALLGATGALLLRRRRDR